MGKRAEELDIDNLLDEIPHLRHRGVLDRPDGASFRIADELPTPVLHGDGGGCIWSEGVPSSLAERSLPKPGLPLHVGFTSDRGGNTIPVRWFRRKSELRKVWDKDIIETAGDRFYDNVVEEFLDALKQNITGEWSDQVVKGRNAAITRSLVLMYITDHGDYNLMETNLLLFSADSSVMDIKCLKI
ncbi:hypothetical protein ZIOFF_024604 [Zingiber officinale]|uniref:Aspergillus nuclease S1 n=1 Tax=Zingiber officinale TaxID=94328 RepID=A0A8J5GWL2_ZINOF|nr:hypothetical protein ZIOFF_024604 [Zingiber officinale]